MLDETNSTKCLSQTQTFLEVRTGDVTGTLHVIIILRRETEGWLDAGVKTLGEPFRRTSRFVQN